MNRTKLHSSLVWNSHAEFCESFINFLSLHASPNSAIVLSVGPGVKSVVFKGFTPCMIYRETRHKWGSGAHLRKSPTEPECEIIIGVILQNTRAHKHKDMCTHKHLQSISIQLRFHVDVYCRWN